MTDQDSDGTNGRLGCGCFLLVVGGLASLVIYIATGDEPHFAIWGAAALGAFLLLTSLPGYLSARGITVWGAKELVTKGLSAGGEGKIVPPIEMLTALWAIGRFKNFTPPALRALVTHAAGLYVQLRAVSPTDALPEAGRLEVGHDELNSSLDIWIDFRTGTIKHLRGIKIEGRILAPPLPAPPSFDRDPFGEAPAAAGRRPEIDGQAAACVTWRPPLPCSSPT